MTECPHTDDDGEHETRVKEEFIKAARTCATGSKVEADGEAATPNSIHWKSLPLGR